MAFCSTGRLVDLTDETSAYHDEAVDAVADIRASFSEAWAELTDGADSVGDDLKELAEWLGMELLGSIKGAAHELVEVVELFNMLAEVVTLSIAPIKQMLQMLGLLSDVAEGAKLAHGERGRAELKSGTAPTEREIGAIKAPPVYNFTGDIHIQQDFKEDHDPDRIAIAFKDRLGRAATNRVSANTQVPQSSF